VASFGFGSSELIWATAENSGLLHDLTAIDIWAQRSGPKEFQRFMSWKGRSDIGV
jgi:hypothetical protein